MFRWGRIDKTKLNIAHLQDKWMGLDFCAITLKVISCLGTKETPAALVAHKARQIETQS